MKRIHIFWVMLVLLLWKPSIAQQWPGAVPPLLSKGVVQPDVKARGAIDTIARRLIRDNIAGGIKIHSKEVKRLIRTMMEDGSWSDIDYSDTSITLWRPLEHLERLGDMAIAYCSEGNGLYHTPVLKQCLLKGLTFFYNRKPVSSNWWYRDIGSPAAFMVPLLLLKGEIPEKKLLQYASYLKDETTNLHHQGMNLAWVARIALYKGCIEGDLTLIDHGFAAMASLLRIQHKNGAEGIKIDHSFHQHHQQLYSGGYGMALIGEIAHAVVLASGTRFDTLFTADRLALLANTVLQGHQILSYRSVVDFGAIGRNISRPGGMRGIGLNTLGELIEADSGHRADYRQWRKNLLGGPYPQRYLGNRYFWKSAIMTQHGRGYYLSAKIISKQTLGTESLNRENVLGHSLPLGATNIMTTGKEYYNIFPLWDWCRVPGTTAVQNPDSASLTGYLYGTNYFGGGVSNGQDGIIAFDGDYRGARAKKAYFFVGGKMLCLGAGITSQAADAVLTAVNQCFLNGEIWIGDQAGSRRFGRESQRFDSMRWVYHDHMDYLFPAGEKVILTQKRQVGSWRHINSAESPEPVSGEVFSLSVQHGIRPRRGTYQYIVAPAASEKTLEKIAETNSLIVIRNDTAIQAAFDTTSGVLGAVFYKAGTLTLPDSKKITVTGPVILILSRKGSNYQIAVADPTYSQRGVRVQFEDPEERGKEADNRVSEQDFIFPPGDLCGKPVQKDLPVSFSLF